MMSKDAIRLIQLAKRFGTVLAVDSISLDIRAGEFFSLLGPSGCGKTTLLRLIAGLELPDSGSLEIYGKEMTRAVPQKRPVNTVFQNYALFPHLTVFDNVGFALRMRKITSPEIQRRVKESMDLVQISELSSRFPHEISGGQKQRVALARALINQPEVLLLDEPLAAIDAKLRKQLQCDLRQLQRKLGTTFIYVTHDQEEALSMSDRIAVMRSGKIEQLGTPEEVYQAPATQFTASFLGSCNLFQGKPCAASTIKTEIGELRIQKNIPPSARLVVGIRPENIQFATGAENTFPGRILEATYSGAQTEYLVKVNESSIRVTALNGSATTQKLQKNEAVNITLPRAALFVLTEND